MNKPELRQAALARRRAIPTRDAIRMSKLITERLLGLIGLRDGQFIHVYTSHTALNEVSTKFIADKVISSSITFGDISKTAIIPHQHYDVIIVPIVAFDSDCNRIGFGGGWYDKFLQMQPHAQKIGLAFEQQRVNAIQVELHDIKLDAVVTEDNVYLPNKNAPLA